MQCHRSVFNRKIQFKVTQGVIKLYDILLVQSSHCPQFRSANQTETETFAPAYTYTYANLRQYSLLPTFVLSHCTHMYP